MGGLHDGGGGVGRGSDLREFRRERLRRAGSNDFRCSASGHDGARVRHGRLGVRRGGQLRGYSLCTLFRCTDKCFASVQILVDDL